MQDMSCLYETLQVILDHAEQIRLTGEFLSQRLDYKWCTRVNANFASENIEFKESCIEGYIEPSIDMFMR